MHKPTPPQRNSAEKEALLSNVALLYYGEGLTQGEIAKRMKVSRATIVNMLRESRDLGVVEIRVDGQFLTGSSLARELREKYGLADVYVAQPAAEGVALSRDESLRQLARVAAMADSGRRKLAWTPRKLLRSPDAPKERFMSGPHIPSISTKSRTSLRRGYRSYR